MQPELNFAEDLNSTREDQQPGSVHAAVTRNLDGTPALLRWIHAVYQDSQQYLPWVFYVNGRVRAYLGTGESKQAPSEVSRETG